MNTQVLVTFQPQGRKVSVLRGTTLLEAAARAGFVLDTPCGGNGTCGKCRVQVGAGRTAPCAADRRIFAEPEIQDGWRLACQTSIGADTLVTLPEGSLLAGTHQILAGTSTTDATPELRPGIRKCYVDLSAPNLEDDAPDLLRLERGIGPFKADLPLLRRTAATLRQQDFRGTAVLADRRLLDFEPGDTRAQCHAVAFDIGTTTLVGQLLSLGDGRELGVVSRLNPQVSFGDDVLSRIRHGGSCPECLEEMRLALTRELAGMIDELCANAGISRSTIYETAFAGNTTMEHILCGINPAQLGVIPFVPVHARGLLFPAREIGIPIHHGALAYVFPIIGGFVGGDTVAGLVATALDQVESPALMVDIGTNGEIVLAHDGRLYAASTAAGPAFEGARIACGMRGTRGAIEKVVFNGNVRIEVIGNAQPAGLCGSGLIDLVAALLTHGLVTPEGRLRPRDELPSGLSPAIAERVETDAAGEMRFLVAATTPGRTAPPVVLTQRDIREVQLGSGAIRAGILLLLRQAGLDASALRSVLIAGGFGHFIRRSSAERIGLLPAGIDHRRVRSVGNVSLAGARIALLSTEARRHGEKLARKVEHVDLSAAEGFHETFADAMLFPEPQPAPPAP